MRAGVAAVILAAAICALPREAFADRVILKNGDALTGTIVTSSPSTVVIDSELAGRVTIARDGVSQIVTAGPGAASVAAATATAPAAEVESPWHGAINAGVDLSRGNAETTTITTNGVATRLTDHDRLGVFATQLFSSIGSGADAVTTARAARGGVRYDHDLAGPVFGFGFTDLENDPLQLLDLRSVVGGGGGFHLLKRETSQVNVFAGVSFAHDSYAQADSTTTTSTTTTTTATTGTTTGTTAGTTTTAPGRSGSAPGRGVSARDLARGGTPPPVVRTTLSRDVGEFLIGEDVTHQLSDAIGVDERFTFFPAVNSFTDYRYSLDFSLSARINSWLQWNVDVADRYLHIPPAGGAVQNDTFLSTGLGITFGGGETESYTGADGRRIRR